MLSSGIQVNPITNERIDKWKVPIRKFAHYILFAFGGFILYFIMNCFPIKHKILTAVLIGMLLACTDELHQIYSSGRGPGIADVGIDSLGIISGVILAVICTKIIKRFKRGKKYD